MGDLHAEIRALAQPLQTSRDLDPLIEAIGDRHYVLIGEASHGTAEYYTWRAELTKRLILEKGFSFVAVEGDWPDCFQLNRWVKGRERTAHSAHDVLRSFERWPTWMWANEEVATFLTWLRAHNETGADVGFYGLDVYSLWDSMEVVLNYLEQNDPDALEAAETALQCFEPYGEDAQSYAWSTRMVPSGCSDEVLRLLRVMHEQAGIVDSDPEANLDAIQNAEVAANAEEYYRTMMTADEESWNVRDTHMADTLDRLVAHHGSGAKAVVWEHNTHVGDARATDMAAEGLVNVGQLVRERHLDDVFIVGMSGYQGAVIASDEWGEPMERMPVPEARQGTHEDLIHQAVGEASVFVFPDDRSGEWLSKHRGHRAIGVVYRPHRDRYGNWVTTRMGARYDALMYFDETEALHPLHFDIAQPNAEFETYPSGT